MLLAKRPDGPMPLAGDTRDSARPRYNHAYLVVGEWMYWTMPGTIAEQGVINRAEPDVPPEVPREVDS